MKRDYKNKSLTTLKNTFKKNRKMGELFCLLIVSTVALSTVCFAQSYREDYQYQYIAMYWLFSAFDFFCEEVNVFFPIQTFFLDKLYEQIEKCKEPHSQAVVVDKESDQEHKSKKLGSRINRTTESNGYSYEEAPSDSEGEDDDLLFDNEELQPLTLKEVVVHESTYSGGF